ncbi:Hypp5986 [Branchiostoma lanceolatum]|uniref:Hypp5986 protein n=1 Tax=Branchiostoma lanceolatum TaxID=7740 RepID=A0A8J9VT65_BRALA|nr:Hypp5986 [Branchiostoma lanceolatum]
MCSMYCHVIYGSQPASGIAASQLVCEEVVSIESTLGDSGVFYRYKSHDFDLQLSFKLERFSRLELQELKPSLFRWSPQS